MSTSAPNSAAYKQAKEFALVLLQKEKQPTPELIAEKVKQAAQFAEMSTPGEAVDVDELIAEFEGIFSHFVADGRILSDAAGHEPWLTDRRSQTTWAFWERYRRFLTHDASLPIPVVNALDTATDEVLGLLEDPDRKGAWDRRGLVVGSVQSGKTGNYTGLICKALDAGYKLVIIMAGMHNSLRSQTQLRTDEGVTGFDTSKNQFYNQGNEWVGVGLQAGERLRISSLTTSAEKGDFKKSIGRNSMISLGGDPFILIVKKNKSILENLLAWALTVNGTPDPNGVDVGTGARTVRDVPLLLIDDEADIASINTKALPQGEKESDYERSAINKGIVQLLKAFEKKAYVGYTATPFANIFIDPDDPADIFPRSFILNLEQPPNYVGPARVFGLAPDEQAGIEEVEALPLVNPIDDYEPYFPEKYGMDHDPGGLPPSMTEAIRAFVLVCAARRARGQVAKHNSMLIHVARFVKVQDIVHQLVDAELKSLKRRIEYGDGAGQSVRDELRELWEREFEPKTAQMQAVVSDCPPVAWEDVDKELHAAAQKIDVKQINGEAQDVLDYFEHKDIGRSVIAVGGDKLSRGLTLEGLSISYYLRITKMYDSLMQMGRWFGYRPGYLDLCRLYTTSELQEWYRYIALADLELRREFTNMSLAGRTPRDYGLRVRTHPDGMLVTALNKSKRGEKRRLSYTGELIQTTHLDKAKAVIQNNFTITSGFLNGLGAPKQLGDIIKTTRDARLWTEVPADKVTAFLRDFAVHPLAFQADGVKLAKYIQRQLDVGTDDLASWTVAMISNSTALKRGTIGPAANVGFVERDPARIKLKDDPAGPSQKAVPPEVDPDVYTMRQRNIITPTDQFLDFEGVTVTEEMIAKVLSKRMFQGEPMEAERKIIQNHKGKPALKLALELTRHRANELKPGSGPNIADPSGRVIRELRPDSRGLLLLYPLDPAPKNGIVNIDSSIVSGNTPIMGFAVSFPVSEKAQSIEYLVNDVFRASESAGEFMLEELADED